MQIFIEYTLKMLYNCIRFYWVIQGCRELSSQNYANTDL